MGFSDGFFIFTPSGPSVTFEKQMGVLKNKTLRTLQIEKVQFTKHLILLNYTENPFSNKANNKINNINVYDYEVLEKNKNCYLLGIKW